MIKTIGLIERVNRYLLLYLVVYWSTLTAIMFFGLVL